MSVRCDHTAEDVMFLLKRNWFMEPQDAYDLIEFLPDDVYYEVYYRRHELPLEAQLYFQDDTSKFKLQVIPYPEKEWEKEQADKCEARMKYMKDFKKNYIAPPRTREPIDDEIDRLTTELESKKVIYEDMLRGTRRTKKYAPPGMSAEEDDPMVREMKLRIQILENELNILTPEAESLDKLWTDLSGLDAMLANVVSSFAATP